MMDKLKIRHLVLMLLLLLLTAVLIVYIVETKNKNTDEQRVDPPIGSEEPPVPGERITKAEAIRLFSFLFYNRSERNALQNTASFSDTAGTWYDSYVNAGVHAGFLQATGRELQAEDVLDSGMFSEMLSRVCEAAGLQFEEIAVSLPERLKTARNKDDVLLQEFMQVYYCCVEAQADSENGSRLERTSFLVVNTEEAGNEQLFVTETGESYRCGKFQDYSDLFAGTGGGDNGAIEQEAVVPLREYPVAEDYVLAVPEILCCGNEIVFVVGMKDEAVTIPNVLIFYGEENTLDTYINSRAVKLPCAMPLEEELVKQIADVTVQGKKVTGLAIKPDVINGKVLLTGDGQIEIEGYGSLPLQENYRIYKLYGSLSVEPTNSILVGYDNVTFVIEENEICAALITEAIKAENIRVLISVDQTANYFHEQVVISSDAGFTATVGNATTVYLPGEELVLEYALLSESKERVFLKPQTESGKIRINSIRRSHGIPQYRGTVEIIAGKKGLLVVNELPIEEYLYAVVPSEMPVSHGEEALKVQAVCARSYAYQQLMGNRYAKYGAHVDDTVNCQVYNNIAETKSSIFAVKDTYGKVMQYGDEVVTAYYFSTSSGHTSSVEDVWKNYDTTEYFSGKIQLTEDSKKAMLSEAQRVGIVSDSQSQDAAMTQLIQMVDLSAEDVFRDFIREEILTIESEGKQLQQKVRTYDSEFSWYRWEVTLDAEELSAQVERLLPSRISAAPEEILTKVSEEGKFVTPSGTEIAGTYKKVSDTTIGQILGFEVVSRAKSGMITELLIRGSEHTILVRNQTNIRTLLAPENTTVYLSKNVTVNGFSLLPSAFFYIEPGSRDGKTVYVLFGGGYGHGVGMSQNGVKSLANEGYSYEGILEHYYTGITLGFIY